MTTTAEITKYQELLGVKMRLDKFFSMFLDQYGDQMDSDNTDTPVWKLYKAKLKEYDTVSRSIKEQEYWLKKAELNDAANTKIAAAKAEAEAVAAEKKAKEDAIAAGAFETIPAKEARLQAEKEAFIKQIYDKNEYHEIYNPDPNAPEAKPEDRLAE